MTGKSYLFVDGAYLKGALESQRRFFFDSEPIINYTGLLADCQKAFYYDALPGRKCSQTEEEHQVVLDEAERMLFEISSTPSWHVNVGFTKGQGKRIKQQGVDVQLAINALMHRIRGNCERIVLIAGDLDFHPLAEALVEAGAYLELLCEHSSVAPELRHAVDKVTYFTPKNGGEYAVNWKNTIIRCTQQSAETTPQVTLVKEGVVADGTAKILHDGSMAHLVYRTKGMNMFHLMSHESAEKLEFHATIELPYIKWR